MNKEKFLEKVKEEIKPLLPDNVEDVVIYPVAKNNGIMCDGLIIVNSSLNITPTIYLDSFYQQYQEGRPFESVLAEIMDIYETNCPNENFNVSMVTEWEQVKPYVIRKLVNYDSNRVLLQDTPHKMVEDLAVVYQVLLNKFMGENHATILVRDNLFQGWDIPLDELDKTACENTKKLLPSFLAPMEDVLRKKYEESYNPLHLAGGIVGDVLLLGGMAGLGNLNMHVITNTDGLNGAVHILEPDIMDEVARKCGDEFFVIPSSIHEVLVLPFDSDYDYQEIEEMICEINRTELYLDDILSDKAYVVDAVNHKLVLAERYEEYRKELQMREQREELLKKEMENKEPRAPKF